MKHLIVRGLSWLALSQGSTQIQRIVFGAILARLIAPSEFGVMGMVATFSGVIALFQLQGFASALIQKQNITETHKSSVFWLTISVGFLLALLMIWTAPWVGKFYHNDLVIPVARVMAVVFVISSLGAVHIALLTKTMDFKTLSIVDILGSTIGGVVAIVLAFRGAGVWSLVWQWIVTEITRVVVLWTLSDWRPRLLFRYRSIYDMLGFGVNLQVSSFFKYANQNIDNILIGKFLGSTSLGYYDRAYQLMRLPAIHMTTIIGRVFFPAFAKFQDDHAKIRRVFLRATQFIAFIVFPLAVGAIVTAPEFITLLYGPRWTSTIFPFQVLALVGALQTLGFFGTIYLSQGRTDILLYMQILAVSLIVPAIVIGMRWNINGVAIAYAIANVLSAIPNQYVGLRLIGIRLRDYYRNLLPMTIASTMMGGSVWFARLFLVQKGMPDWVIFIGCLMVGAATYLGLMKLIASAVLQELMGSIAEIRNLKNTQVTPLPDAD